MSVFLDPGDDKGRFVCVEELETETVHGKLSVVLLATFMRVVAADLREIDNGKVGKGTNDYSQQALHDTRDTNQLRRWV